MNKILVYSGFFTGGIILIFSIFMFFSPPEVIANSSLPPWLLPLVLIAYSASRIYFAYNRHKEFQKNLKDENKEK